MAKPNGLANQKLCYFQIFLDLEKIWRTRLRTFISIHHRTYVCNLICDDGTFSQSEFVLHSNTSEFRNTWISSLRTFIRMQPRTYITYFMMTIILANQKLCYIQMLINLEKSGEQDLETSLDYIPRTYCWVSAILS